MASGDAVRFGGGKLTAPFRGRPLIAYIIEKIIKIPFAASVVVTRQQPVADVARGMGMHVLLHDQPLVSDTISLGTRYIMDTQRDDGQLVPQERISGCMYCVADQPLLTLNTLHRMTDSFASWPDCIIRLAWRSGQDGSIRYANPVIFPASMFPLLTSLPPGQTGRYVIQSHKDAVRCVFADQEQELWDVDTKEELDRMQAAADDTIFNNSAY